MMWILYADSPQSPWSTDFENFVTRQNGYDIYFIMTGQLIKARKAMLSLRSSEVAAIFHSDKKQKGMDQIPIPDIAADIFYSLFRYMYTERVNLTERNAAPLLAAADKYLLRSNK